MSETVASVVVDAREPKEFDTLFRNDDYVESVTRQQIPVGDFRCRVDPENPPIVFERKTASDFVKSMKNKRLETQINGMYDTFGPERSFLVIEGDLEDFDFLPRSSFPPESIRGFMGSLCGRWQLVPLFCSDQFHLADMVVRVSRKCVEQTDRVVRSPDSTPNTKDPSFYDRALLQLDGVGPETKDRIKEEFPTLQSLIMNSSPETLQEIDGIGSGKSSKIVKQINDY